MKVDSQPKVNQPKPIFHFQTRHYQGEAWLEFATYTDNDRVAIELWDSEGCVMRVTTNYPEVSLKPGQLLVKDYSENAGIYSALALLGLITPTEIAIPLSQFATAKVADATPFLRELAEEQGVSFNA